ncbi:MAG: sulfite exporter TauE/SafE family protein [Anaerolineales bacterium]|nr:sulfite exporter TauE/SafE family protein [Anaerolineales bacterium]
MEVSWWLSALVIGAGFICGVINTLAGSGSLISLPILIFLGLPAPVANGTNRVGILLQNLAAGWSFKQSRVLDLRGALVLSVPAVLGSILGASVAVNLNEELMERVIGAVMLLMLVILILRPERWLQGSLLELASRLDWKQSASMFVIGAYGGFIQAGVGVFLLAALVLSVGYDLVRANAVKIIIILAFSLSSLLVFSNNSQVDWGMGLLLGLGNMLGGWVAARLAVNKGANWVRWVVIATVGLSVLYLFDAFDYLLAFLGS